MDSHSWKDVNVTKIEGENNDIIRKIKPYFVTTFHILKSDCVDKHFIKGRDNKCVEKRNVDL